MANKVTIVDDTFRANCFDILHGRRVLRKDDRGHQVQEIVQSKIVFDGRALTWAVQRAKRWMRSRRFREGRGTPRHLAVMMAVYHKADPEGFEKSNA